MVETGGMFRLYPPALLCLSNLGFGSFRRDADDAGTILKFGPKLRLFSPLQKTYRPGTFGPL